MQLKAQDSNKLEDALLSASRAMVAIAAKSFSLIEDQITLTQYRVLIILATEGSQQPSMLASRLSLKPYFVTRLCDHLIDDNLISRRSSITDRRKIELSVTPKGKSLVSKVISARRETLRTLVDEIPEDRREIVGDAFRCFAEVSSNVFEEKFLSDWLP